MLGQISNLVFCGSREFMDEVEEFSRNINKQKIIKIKAIPTFFAYTSQTDRIFFFGLVES